MDFTFDLARAGKEIETGRIAHLLDLPTATVERMSVADRSLLRQAIAALLSPEVWETAHANRLLHSIQVLTSNPMHPTMSHRTSSIYLTESVDCVAFMLDGYEERGFAYAVENATPTHFDHSHRPTVSLLESTGEWPWITEYVGCVVLTGPPNAGAHHSYSLASLPGTVLSQSFMGAEQAAITLVHEGSHTLFNYILEGARSVGLVNRLTQQFYSPWRNAMRPAFGFLHAVFAFGRIAAFQLKAERMGCGEIFIGSQLAAECGRLKAIEADLNQCLDTIGSDKVSDVFSELYREIETEQQLQLGSQWI